MSFLIIRPSIILNDRLRFADCSGIFAAATYMGILLDGQELAAEQLRWQITGFTRCWPSSKLFLGFYLGMHMRALD